MGGRFVPLSGVGIAGRVGRFAGTVAPYGGRQESATRNSRHIGREGHADGCGQRGVSFDTLVHVRPDDLHPDTYSPLRDKYPDGNLSLSVGELLKYTLHLSDNNACDILFRVFGGPAATDEYLRSMGLRDFAIEVTEDDMHRNLADCYRNWTTPLGRYACWNGWFRVRRLREHTGIS